MQKSTKTSDKPKLATHYPWYPGYPLYPNYPWCPPYPPYDIYGCEDDSSSDSSDSSDESAANIPIKRSQYQFMKASVPVINLTQTQIDDITTYINSYRIAHQAPPLVWDPNIAIFSQSWSNNLLNNNEFKHSGNSLYGENIAYLEGYGTDIITLLKQAVDMWYNEVSSYDFTKPAFSYDTGHFTCLVWKSSTNYGIGIAIDPSTETVDITFNTSPPGNVIGEFETNVLPANTTINIKPIQKPIIVPIKPPMPMPKPTPTPTPHNEPSFKNNTDIIKMKAYIVPTLYSIINDLNKNKSKSEILTELHDMIIKVVNM